MYKTIKTFKFIQFKGVALLFYNPKNYIGYYELLPILLLRFMDLLIILKHMHVRTCTHYCLPWIIIALADMLIIILYYFIDAIRCLDLGMGKSALSLFIDDQTGGILDDLIITKTNGDYLYMVTNAGCKEQDMRMLTEQLVNNV